MAEFSAATTASVKMKVNTNTSGNIAQSGDTVKGTKYPSIAGIKASATLAEANAVFSAFYGTIAEASYDSLTAVKTITQEVTD